MDSSVYDAIDRALGADDASEAFQATAERLRQEGLYPALFELRLLEKRLELGLPVAPGPAPKDLPDDVRRSYDDAQVAAAREAGRLFLERGDIAHAWPYFRALGEVQPVAEAIQKFQAGDGDERLDAVIEIAYQEGVHPRRGFELILEHFGICRAITLFHHYPSVEGREASAALLIDRLYGDLLANLKRAVQQVEGQEPASDSVLEVISGRDWLFEGMSYYLDTSHVSSVVQLGPGLEDPRLLERIVELTEYGRRLAPMYQFPGQPPFESVYEDTGAYLRALLGRDVDAAVERFRSKLSPEPDPYGDPAAQALVTLLASIGRPAEALDVLLERLSDIPPSRVQCPTVAELAEQAGAFDRWAEAARAHDDAVSYLAAKAAAARLEASRPAAEAVR